MDRGCIMDEITIQEFNNRIIRYGIKELYLDWADQSQSALKLLGMSFSLRFNTNVIVSQWNAELLNLTFEIVGQGGSFTLSNIKKIMWEDMSDTESIIKFFYEDERRMPVLMYAK